MTIKHRRLLWAVLIVMVATVIVSATLIQHTKRTREMPLVYSIIKNVTILSLKIIDADTPAARLAIEVRNESDKDIMAVDLVAGDGAVTKNGLTDEDNPIVVIPPHGTTVLEMGFGEMTPGAPVVVSAVTYADGSEEGDEKSLRAMHIVRKHDREQKRLRQEQKGAEKP